MDGLMARSVAHAMDTAMSKHPESSCCGARAKLDKTAKKPGTWFCTKCVKTCNLAKKKFVGSTLGKPRTPTGERKLMIELYLAQRGRCAISGGELWPPEHPMFHHQGSHILPKGTYPEYRLKPENMVMVRKFYHDQWEAEKDKERLIKIEPRWKPHVDTYNRLFREAQQHNRPWESVRKTTTA